MLITGGANVVAAVGGELFAARKGRVPTDKYSHMRFGKTRVHLTQLLHALRKCFSTSKLARVSPKVCCIKKFTRSHLSIAAAEVKQNACVIRIAASMERACACQASLL